MSGPRVPRHSAKSVPHPHADHGFEPVDAQPGDTIALRFLEEDGQQVEDVTAALAGFILKAETSLELAIYDCRLSAIPAEIIRAALDDRKRAGVAIRLVFDAGEKPQLGFGLDAHGTDPAPPDTHERVRELGQPSQSIRSVTSFEGLMHHKYVVRDAAAVWTGSLNWSDDGMRRMENLVVTVESPHHAAFFRRDFHQLWKSGHIGTSGAFPTEPRSLQFAGQPAMTDVEFSPGRGQQINERMADRILGAKSRIVICSMLLNSSKILRALQTQLARGNVEIWGVYDASQMGSVLHQWTERQDLQWKIEAVTQLVETASLVGKRSTPYHPGQSHNFLHNKTLVIDDTVITGSYNLSHAAQGNSENMLVIESPAMAEAMVTYIWHLVQRYAEPPAYFSPRA